MMTTSDILSTIALVVSGLSLFISAHAEWRDRGRLRATSRFFPAYMDEDDGQERPASMRVEAVNTGQRPIILTMLVGNYDGGGWSGRYIGEHEKGLRLGENEKFTEDIELTDRRLLSREGDAILDLRFEDTLGGRYRVKDAKKHLVRLLKNEGHKVKTDKERTVNH